MKMASLLTLSVGLLFSLTVSAAHVQHSTLAADSMGMAGKSAQQNPSKLKVKSREQAIQRVKQQYQGQVLKAQSSRVQGHPGYKVKLISKEGLVFYVSVDAQTGSISRN